jgi:hypothetical protein
LFALKNQNIPVSVVSVTAVPTPDAVVVCHEAVTRNRPLFKQRAVEVAVQFVDGPNVANVLNVKRS